jgi:hypothetical protein
MPPTLPGNRGDRRSRYLRHRFGSPTARVPAFAFSTFGSLEDARTDPCVRLQRRAELAPASPSGSRRRTRGRAGGAWSRGAFGWSASPAEGVLVGPPAPGGSIRGRAVGGGELPGERPDEGGCVREGVRRVAEILCRDRAACRWAASPRIVRRLYSGCRSWEAKPRWTGDSSTPGTRRRPSRVHPLVTGLRAVIYFVVRSNLRN